MPGSEVIGAEERQEVLDVIESGILFRYNFENVRKDWKAFRFEDEVKAFTGAKYAHAVSSGTTAVSLMLAACGVGAGDEVIVPPFTYVATVEAVLLAGAVPVFAEIDETLCLSPEGIEAVLTPNTKAVLLVHMCGAMAKIEEIKALCDSKNVKLLEDTAQALGAFYHGKSLGLFGMMGGYSFDFFKIVTCGEGGVVVTNDEELYNKAHQFSDHGHDHIGTNRGLEEHPVLGNNFRISELNAAVGLAQMRKLPTILERQKANKAFFKDVLEQYEGVTFRYYPDPSGDSATFLSFFLPTEAQTLELLKHLAVEGVDGCQYWNENKYHYIHKWDHLKNYSTIARMPIELMPNRPDYHTMKFPKSDDLIARLISMVIKNNWTAEEKAVRAEKMHRALAQVLKLKTVNA